MKTSYLSYLILDIQCQYLQLKKDVENILTMTSETKTIQGLGTTVQVQGEEKVRCIFKDDYGLSQEVYIKAYYIPTSSVRLFSPQSYSIQEQSGGFSLDKDGSIFTFTSGKTLTFKYSNKSRFQIANASLMKTIPSEFLNATPALPSSGKLNILAAQE